MPRTAGPLVAEEIYALRGANYFSWDPVVVLRLDLASFDEVFTNQIPQFNERLQQRVPSLVEHKCSEGVRGGFFMRMEMGTLLGHVLEHVALELQSLAGIDVAFGKTRSTARQGVYNVVFRYQDEPVGIAAAELAYDVINSTLTNHPCDIAAGVARLARMHREQMGDLARAVIEEARRRDVPTRRFDAQRELLIGTGPHAHRIGYFAEAEVPNPEQRAAELLDDCFPPGRPTHAPLMAVAGARGGELAARLLGHCLSLEGRQPAVLTAENYARVGQSMADPAVDAMVLQVPLATIVEQGLPYRMADVGMVLNAAGHPAINPDITAEEDMAYALAVVVEEVRDAGVAVLNADDPHVIEMAKRIYARPVFFTRERDLRFLSEHITAGNMAIVLTGDLITLEQYREQRPICRLDEIPLLATGEPHPGAIDAVLATCGALAGYGWSTWAIAKALAGFV